MAQLIMSNGIYRYFGNSGEEKPTPPTEVAGDTPVLFFAVNVNIWYVWDPKEQAWEALTGGVNVFQP